MAAHPTLRLVRDDDGLEQAGWVVTEKKQGECPHLWPVIDARLRTVECGRCGATLDPVQVLLDMADRRHKIDTRIEELTRMEAFRVEREKASRVESARKEHRHLIAAFGDTALVDFAPYGGTTVSIKKPYDGPFVNEYTHRATGRKVYVERRAARFWARGPGGWARVEVSELKQALYPELPRS